MEQHELEPWIDKKRRIRASEVYLRRNLITNLPESIGNLPHLTKLKLEINRVTKLPESIGNLSNLVYLDLRAEKLTTLPESIGYLSNLNVLCISGSQFTTLPESIGNLSKLTKLEIRNTKLSTLPDSIGSLANLTHLDLSNNQFIKLPQSIASLSSLKIIDLNENTVDDLSVFQSLPKLYDLVFLDVYLPLRYWKKISDWKPEWLLDERNAEIRQKLIQKIGYERICQELDAVELDSWREYALLKIDDAEIFYDEITNEEEISREPMVLLKMTCPSTEHIHILRVPPDMTSAEAAITWVNHGIHPDEFSTQT